MAKIAIIEDSVGDIFGLLEVLKGEGHQVLALVPCLPSLRRLTGKEGDDFKFVESVEEIVSLVSEFGPDMVLLDHSLDMPYKGDDVAYKLRIEREKLIGTSSSFTQAYCGKKFGAKSHLGHRDFARAALLEVVGSYVP